MRTLKFGKMFDGTWGCFYVEDMRHAVCLLMGITNCDCEYAVPANGKLLFVPLHGYPLYLSPADIVCEQEINIYED